MTMQSRTIGFKYEIARRQFGLQAAIAVCALALFLWTASLWVQSPSVFSGIVSSPSCSTVRTSRKALPARVLLPVASLLQTPELPNGCEATSLAMLLQSYGLDADKISLAYDYIPRQDFTYTFWYTFGPNPERFYAGDPSSEGFYCFAGTLAKGANAFLQQANSDLRAVDITGCSSEQLRATLAQGRPVVVWATIGMEPSRLTETFTWYFYENGQRYHPYSNLHCLLLYGYDNEYYYLMDPLTGVRATPRIQFEARWSEMGQRALVLSDSMDRPPYRSWADSRNETVSHFTLPGRQNIFLE